MKSRILTIISLLLSLLLLCSCTASDGVFFSKSSSSTFNIRFIDVGQGDSALVECDGHYMLIDGGDKSAGDKVYSVLEENQIQHLDILAMSHLHEDHIGGLTKALRYATKIDKTIANSDFRDNETFRSVEKELGTNGAKITVPHEGEKFELGSAVVEVVDVASEEDNDSLVLMITYGKTRFLFTGDIEATAQSRISDKYENENDDAYKIDLIKIPHHGSFENTSLNRFIRTFMPDNAMISVGENNKYGHPHKETLDLLDDADVTVYRTDKNGDIIVKSNGKEVSIETTK